MSKESISVIAIDDHNLILDGIHMQIERAIGMEVIATGQDGDAVIELVKTHQPDILLLDIEMPQYKRNGENEGKFQALSAVRRLSNEYPVTKIIIISQHVSHSLTTMLFSRGVRGYLLKDDGLTQKLPDTIRAVMGGGIYFSSSINISYRDMEPTQDDPLTPRMKEIILLMVKQPEDPYAKLAQQLGITEGAFRNRLSEAFRRLNVTNRTSCIIECLRRGIITIDD